MLFSWNNHQILHNMVVPRISKNKTMKNIHILPTDKPDFVIFKNRHLGDRLFHWNMDLGNPMNRLNYVGQNIYITSDEEIKVGDWVYDIFKNACPVIRQLKTEEEVLGVQETELKIILTTDQDLIKDSVQAIDDEFLEWFIKNPNCEGVEAKKEYITPLGDIVETCYDNERLNYKIIIPKEEPKQETMKIFKELNKLGYKHYTEHTIEELDDLPLNSKERIMEQALVLRWFREKYNSDSYIRHECPDVKPYYDFVIDEDVYDVMKDTYEEAELACLRKLIEITKEKQHDVQTN